MESRESYRNLAAYRHCIENISSRWAHFGQTRADRLRHGEETERVAEAILEDLFTDVLDWSKGDITYQVDFADIVLSKNLAKYLVIEVKRPGMLWPGRQRFDDAIQQARRYADEQRISRIAVSDGRFLYAANIENGTTTDRLLADLSSVEPPLSLWWLSVHGVYRPWQEPVVWPTAAASLAAEVEQSGEGVLLHPKYKLPSTCFAYVGDANDPRTWKLPFRAMDGCVDAKRLPKAIQALLSNYRGAKVRGIPEVAIGEVLMTLARAAAAEGRMPPQAAAPAGVYCELARVLDQLGLSINFSIQSATD